MPALDDLAHLLREPAGEPAGALVLMHGRGTSEHDLFPLLDALDPDRRLLGACPRAPLQRPPGGFHWYDVMRVGFPDPDTFKIGREGLDGWLEALAEHTGVPPDRTVLGGFSQGAVMAWAMGAGRARPRPAGIMALSGFIPTVPGFALDRANLNGLPVAIVHGTLDPIIPVDLGRAAYERARAAGADVLYRETEVPHTVDPSLLPQLAAWLQRRFPAAG